MKAYDATLATAPQTQPARPAVVYADCRAALEIAWRDGLSRDVPVRSVAPAVVADAAIAAERAVERLGARDIAALSEALVAAIQDVWRELSSDVALADGEQIALIAARAVITDLQNEIFMAAMLREEDFGRGVVAVTVRHAEADMRRRFYFGAARILAEAGQARIIEVAAEKLLAIGEPAPPKPPLLPRLTHLSLDTAIFRLGIGISRFWPRAAPRGGILVLRENELLKETAARLFKRGYGLYALKSIGTAECDAGPHAAVVEKSVRRAIELRFEGLLAPTALAILARHTAGSAVVKMSRYRASLPLWQAALVDARARRPRAVLTNILLSPEALGLHRVLRELGIPLIVFQHGVSPEINASAVNRGVALDNVGCDLAITFNAEMARLCEENPIGGAPAVVAGIPADYQRASRRRRGANRIWYVSTSLYQSNLGRLHRGMADAEIYTNELDLIDKVLARLPHRVVYKPYPALRYLDDDPLLVHAARQENIEIHEERLDLRYLARKARLLLTCGASSTISRCLMSDKPTVLINSPNNLPLGDAARAAFAAGIFLFDGAAEDFHEQLRAFLSQPFEEIEHAWDARAEPRRHLIETFFSAPHSDPAGRAADAVVAKIGERR